MVNNPNLKITIAEKSYIANHCLNLQTSNNVIMVSRYRKEMQVNSNLVIYFTLEYPI